VTVTMGIRLPEASRAMAGDATLEASAETVVATQPTEATAT